MRTLICWFRRDLRVQDNTALYRAARDADRVLPVFVVDPVLMAPPHGAGPRVCFLLESLRVLDANLRRLGGYLLVRRGDPAAAILGVLRESGAEGVYVNREYLAPARARDQRVGRAVESAGFLYRDFADLLIAEPGDLLTQAGTPYRIFTPYRRAWSSLPAPAPALAPERPLQSPDLPGMAIPQPADLGWGVAADAQHGGEDEGLLVLRRFSHSPRAPIHDYAAARNVPAVPGTSRISPHLRFGTISVRAALAAARSARAGEGADEARGPSAWEGELAWREFYFAWMHHFPHVARRAADARFAALPYEDAGTLLAAWQHGQTGYPIVDAGMRQLNTEGWMHNRVRMITASFLCKDLLVDWRRGEAYFWERLTDADKPANVGGWQWSASVGTDAQPYFRVINPVTQGRRYDPQGAYVRRYVPELASLPPEHVHSPWTLPAFEAHRLGFVLGKSYPAPIVDHAERRGHSLQMFRAALSARGQSAAELDILA